MAEQIVEFVRFSQGITSAAAQLFVGSLDDEALELLKKKAKDFKRPERQPVGVETDEADEPEESEEAPGRRRRNRGRDSE